MGFSCKWTQETKSAILVEVNPSSLLASTGRGSGPRDCKPHRVALRLRAASWRIRFGGAPLWFLSHKMWAESCRIHIIFVDEANRYRVVL